MASTDGHGTIVGVNANPAERPLLVYDGDCAFCTRSVRFVERRISRHPVVRSWQSLDLGPLGLTEQMCLEAVQLVRADSSIVSAHVAVAQTLVHGGGGWAVLGRLMSMPGVKQLAGVVYRWIARNRHRLPGGTAACSIDQRG